MIGTIDSFERNLEMVQLDMEIAGINFIAVLYTKSDIKPKNSTIF